MSGSPIGINPAAAVAKHNAATNPHAFTPAGLALARATDLAAQKTILGITEGGGGSGDVSGPSSSITGHLAVFADETGKVLADGGEVPSGGSSLEGAMFLGEFLDASSNPQNPSGTIGETRYIIAGGILTGYYGWQFPVSTGDILICLGTENAYGGSNWIHIKQPSASLGTVKHLGDYFCASDPVFPQAKAGDLYRIADSGRIGGEHGIPVKTGDSILCIADTDGGSVITGGIAEAWTIIPVLTDRHGQYISDLDCSGNPLLPEAYPGNIYHITIGGKIGGMYGQDVAPGDAIKAISTAPGGYWGNYGSAWEIVKYIPTISTTDATDLATCQTLVNELKATVNALIIELKKYRAIIP